MRITIMTSVFPALSETFVLDQVTALLDKGHDVRIIAEAARDEAATHAEVERYGLLARTHHLGSSGPRWRRLGTVLRAGARTGWGLAGAARALRRGRREDGETGRLVALAGLVAGLAAAPRPDVILCHFGVNGALMARALDALGWRTPLVTFFHGYDITTMVRERGPRLYRHLFGRGALFMPASERFGQSLRDLGCPAERILVQRMCVDPAALDRAVGGLSPPRLGGGCTFVTVGRLVAKKGTAGAVRAFARAFGAAPADAAHLVIVGEGELRGEIEAIIRAAGIGDRVTMRGALARDEVLGAIHAADVLVQASVTAPNGDMEAMTVAVSEAMALRRPVIATRHGGIPELVQHGVTGLLVAEGDEVALAEAMAWMAANRAAACAMGEAGRARVVEGFAAGDWNALLVERLRGLGAE